MRQATKLAPNKGENIMLTAIIKDVSDFGNVGLQGIHQVIENDRDIQNILYNAERDGFDRAFVYIKGWNEGSFDEFEIRGMLQQLEVAGATVRVRRECLRLMEQIDEILTMKQFQTVHNGSLQYRALFERASKVSKKQLVRELTRTGLKYLSAVGL
jgi:hypothetical protein